MNINDIPIFINSKDRFTYLQIQINRFNRAGLDNIIILDTGTTYEPLLNYYKELPYKIKMLGGGTHLSLWDCGILSEMNLLDSPIVYTDSDVIPTEYCPNDFLQYMQNLLQKYPDIPKIGFGLKIDDLPDHYQHKNAVIDWETQFWKDAIEPNCFRAPIDTTFALYRNGRLRGWQHAIRTGEPYTARHLPWYIDSNNPGEEMLYYKSHVTSSSSWPL